MLEFMTASANLPFTIALAMMALLTVLELLGFAFGASVSGLLDGWFDLDVNVGDVDGSELAAHSLADRFMGWIHFGKVPVLIEGDSAITDSTAILTYLADKHGTFTAAAGSLARARQDSMTQFLLDELDACLWTAARHSFVLPEPMRLPAIKDSLKWEYARSLQRLADRMAGPFLMGDEMTVPDIIATHCLGWGVAARFGAPEGTLAEYLARMRARPAFQRVFAG